MVCGVMFFRLYPIVMFNKKVLLTKEKMVPLTRTCGLITKCDPLDNSGCKHEKQLLEQLVLKKRSEI